MAFALKPSRAVAVAAVILAALLLGGCYKTADRAPTPAEKLVAHVEPIRKNGYTIPHTLRIGDIEEFTSLNPHLADALPLQYLSQLTMAWLVRYGRDNRPTPELATEVPSKQNHLISADGRTITWHLRHGVRWSDGAPFNADDVVFSTSVVNNPRNNEIGRDGFDLIRRIDEPDKFTVVFHLSQPYALFLPSFFGSAGANPCILPKHLLGTLASINHAGYNMKPVGIGPFRYVRWIRGDRVELEPNPYYWRGLPKLKHIIYRFIPDRNTLLTQIQTGEVDLWTLVGLGYFDRVRALHNVVTVDIPSYLYSHVDFNGARRLFTHKVIRQALRLALDRRLIRDKVQHGLGILQEGPITPSSPLYTPLPLIPFDLAKANALLDADGWKRDAAGIRVKAGERFTFTFATLSGQPDYDQALELMRSTWREIGAQMTVQHYPATLMFAPFQDGGIIYAGKFDVAGFSWQMTPDGDLAVTHGCKQMPPNGQNVLHYCDAKTEAFIDASRATYDEVERKRLLAAAERQIVADVPDIVLWIRDDIYTYNRDLHDWHPGSMTPFDDMLGVDI